MDLPHRLQAQGLRRAVAPAPGRATLDLADNVSVDVRGYYSSGRVEFDGFNVDSNDYGLNKEFVGYAGLNFDLMGGRFRNRVAYAYTDTNRDNFNPDRERSRSFEADGKNKRWEYQGSFDVTDNHQAYAQGIYADYTVDGGTARIAWNALPDRVIALVRLKRMEVTLAFSDGVPADARAHFSKQFQMHTLRGGG